jgi:exosortase C (VPDSG-CTERM-specific)
MREYSAKIGVRSEPATPFNRRLRMLGVLMAGLVILFCKPLWGLFRLAFFSEQSDLYSFVPLMPAITGYLIWTRRKRISTEFQPAWKTTAVFFCAGLAVAGGYFWMRHGGWRLELEDYLAMMTLSLLFFVLASGLATLGSSTIKSITFPIALLLFMVPYPTVVLNWIEAFFDQTSAVAACGFFELAQTPVLKEGLILNLPGVALQVAPECSGLHSTLVLLITSLLAGELFLQSKWRRVFLTVFVLPLAILRNGFRIGVIGELCVHIGPHMIHSPIHKKGGPIFFALSLIPFFLVLMYLRKKDMRDVPQAVKPDAVVKSL